MIYLRTNIFYADTYTTAPILSLQILNHSYIIEWYSCTVVQLYSCTVIQLYSCTVIEVYSCTVIEVFSCTVIELYSYTNEHCTQYQSHYLSIYLSIYIFIIYGAVWFSPSSARTRPNWIELWNTRILGQRKMYIELKHPKLFRQRRYLGLVVWARS